MEDYALYLLTGAIFGALVAVVYQLKMLKRLDDKIISLEKNILGNKSKTKK
jgi:hypothetical protein